MKEQNYEKKHNVKVNGDGNLVTKGSENLKVNLSEEKIAELRSAFQLFDGDNNNGNITKNKLKKILNNLNYFPTDDDLNDMVAIVDKNGDGNINFNEFLELMCDKMDQNDSEEEILEAFRIFDKGSKGYVTRVDFKQIMKYLGETIEEDELDELMKDCDEDQDNQLNFEEFKKMMNF
jgi:Ca2+-binding EF-hand superfamily protein